ncbi:MAG TPA: MarR family transcriptional regulator [Verrucomicrobiales bacterium]|jgi:DNA-binding transcriptional regulator GbsR (MarR family)|nr:MarR family transcriptional regulator [Verrucomicrobiales bacterium]
MKGLSPVQQRFILHWGEMGARWGINRTVAQIHALLFLMARPLNAEEITEVLDVARSNVSNSIRELQNWGIIRLVHLPGDRRDHFESLKDVNEMFRIILNERKRRELDPTLRVIRECLDQPAKEEIDATTKERLEAMLGFFELAEKLFGQLDKVSTKNLIRAAKMGGGMFRVLGLTSKE